MRTNAIVRAMRPCSLSLILLVSLVDVLPAQVPPHPDLLARIKSGQVQRPAFMSDIASLRQRGIDAPWSAPELQLRKPGGAQTVQRVFGPAVLPHGSWRALVILVQFSDQQPIYAASRFDTLCFGQSFCTLRDYYHRVSYGNLDLVTLNLPSALGWVTAPQPLAYYVNGNFGWGPYPSNSQKLVEDAVRAVDPVVDYSQYDNDHDGHVDALFVVHAGAEAASSGDPNNMWSHAWSTPQAVPVDGVHVQKYSMIAEFVRNPPMEGMNIFAHEYAHTGFGLPDLYDLDGSSSGLGDWSLMAGGCWGSIGPQGCYPVYPDVWSRAQMGFLIPVNVTQKTSGATLRSSERYPDAYRLGSGGGIGPEYFLVENREPFDYDIPVASYAKGLLVYHIDESVVTQNNREWYPGHSSDGHYLVALEQADGRWDLEHGSSSFVGDEYFEGREFTASTIPGSRDYAGNCTGVSMRNISPRGETMTSALDVTERQVVVLAPNGGEVWKPGTIRTVTWKSAFVGLLKLEYSTNAGTSWNEIAHGLQYTTTQYDWPVPSSESNRCLLRVTDENDPQAGDTSDGAFTVSDKGSPSDIVLGVDSLWTAESAGPIFTWSNSATPIVGADELTATFPSVVALADTAAQGRIVAFGSHGFLLDIDRYDNCRFAVNAAEWLDRQRRRTVVVSTGHYEFLRVNHTLFTSKLEQLGYAVTEQTGRITQASLAGAGILFVGNILGVGSLDESELTAIRQFVEGGGGLFLVGSGISWASFSFGRPLDEYPMNWIGAMFGIRFQGGQVLDNAHLALGHPLFMNMFPAGWGDVQTIPHACAYIDSTAHSFSQYLATVIRQDALIRTRLVQAHSFLAGALTAAPEATPVRQQVFDFYLSLSGGHYWYQKDFWYYNDTQSGMLWLRERACRTLVDAIPLSPSVKSQIASALHLEAGYDRLWTDLSVVSLDNHYLFPPQRDFLRRALGLLPSGIHNLRAVVVPDLLGTTSPPVSLDGTTGEITIGSIQIGTASDNPFPGDAGAKQVDRFSSGVVHAMNHLIDTCAVVNVPKFRARKAVLLAAAGSAHLNYLRSSFADGYFITNPAEFFPSIGDQWFADTRRTLGLAVARHEAGRSSPADQFLFFADIYSRGGDSTSFYAMDTQGGIVVEHIPLQRDAGGNITRLIVDGVTYDFTLDAQGNVVDIALPIQLAYFKASVPADGGVLLVWKTVSETNNYGFEVQKAALPPDYFTMPGSSIAGHGTTTEPHEYSWRDPTGDRSSYYRLKQIDLDGTTHYTEGVNVGGPLGVEELPVPTVHVLEQNYPNPANPSTVIRYGIPQGSHVTLTVYNALGQRVAVYVDGEEDAGFHEVRIDVSNLASGVYFYTLSAGRFVHTKRLLVLK